MYKIYVYIHRGGGGIEEALVVALIKHFSRVLA